MIVPLIRPVNEELRSNGAVLAQRQELANGYYLIAVTK
jgi:hypothetical protein